MPRQVTGDTKLGDFFNTLASLAALASLIGNDAVAASQSGEAEKWVMLRILYT